MRNDKEQAMRLRRNGLSYNEIFRKLKIPKSTLSGWLKTMSASQTITATNIQKNKQKWAANIIAYNKRRSKIARLKWLVMQKDASREIKRLTMYELKLVGSALYWAEGYKKGNWNIVFCNSDPGMLKLMMKFFLKICNVPLNKIKAQVQIHHNVSAKSATHYWSKIINLPRHRFLKPIYQISKASKLKRKNTLPYGTLRIKINDVKLVNKIKGWITSLAR